MDAFFLSLLSVVGISLISLIGFFTLGLKQKTIRSITFLAVSFSVGALFGDVFFHLLPELAENGFGVELGVQIVLGVLVFFAIEKFVHWRHCHIEPSEDHPHPLAFMNLIGDGLHNFLDGVLIASTYALNPIAGFSTTLAVALHELPQEIGDFGVLMHAGLSRQKALLFNLLSGMLAVLGVFVFFVLQQSEVLEGWLVPFTIGGFLYLAGSDLVPELHKETKISKSLLQFVAIVAGLVVMYSLRFLE